MNGTSTQVMELWMIVERCVIGQTSATDHRHCTLVQAVEDQLPKAGDVESSYKNDSGEEVVWIVESVFRIGELAGDASQPGSPRELLTISTYSEVSYSEEAGVLSILDGEGD